MYFVFQQQQQCKKKQFIIRFIDNYTSSNLLKQASSYDFSAFEKTLENTLMTGKKGSRGKMSKRFGAEFEDSFSKAPKRPKLEVTVTREPDRVPKTAEKKDVKKSDKNDEPFDDWGDVIDDFAEIDLIASQAYADVSITFILSNHSQNYSRWHLNWPLFV